MRILLVEDDAILGSAVRDYLTRESYAVDWVETLADARACLPEAIRRRARPRPARRRRTVAAADAPQAGRTAGGADADGARPAVRPRARARCRRRRLPRQAIRPARARRAPARAGAAPRWPPLAAIELGALTIDPVSREVTLAGTCVELTAQEYALVLAFAEHPRRVLSRSQLEDAIYTLEGGAVSNVVEVYVSRLRRKFGRDSIRTVRGVGYRWGVADVVDAEAGE